MSGKNIHPIYLVTTVIKYSDKKIATGFFFSDKGKLYLVTNKHIIYGKDFFDKHSVPKINVLTLTLHTDSQDFTKNDNVTIDLFKDGNRIWIEHPVPSTDIVLIPVDIDRKKFLISEMSRKFIEDADPSLVQCERILVVGYPYGFYDEFYNLPIIKIGHLSSPFNISFKGDPIMVGDVITYPGMSGSPVVMQIKNPLHKDDKGKLQVKFGNKYILAGIYSGQFQVHGKTRKHLINIWFSKVIEWILDQ